MNARWWVVDSSNSHPISRTRPPTHPPIHPPTEPPAPTHTHIRQHTHPQPLQASKVSRPEAQMGLLGLPGGVVLHLDDAQAQ